MSNRAVTLEGANKIFQPAGIQIEHSPLGFYHTKMRGTTYEAKTLTDLCQKLIAALCAIATLD